MTQRIFPMLAYQDAPAAIDFLCRAFGFRERWRMDGEAGTVGHAEVELDGQVVMLASVWRDGGLATPNELGAAHCQLRCVVDDVDGHWRRARDAGAVVVGEPADQDYGERVYRAVDPEGHRWIFASPLDRAEP
ncbi:MAG TPA: VOC family protein [Jiangellaceae bacterium]|nr:VOC family protein [Jiangellaceae bacterium]